MKRIFYIVYVFIIALLFINEVNAQSRNEFPEFENVEKVAQTGYQFLKINSNAQSAAMGGAASTLEGNASSIFSNPAGITSVKDRSVFVGYSDWFADIQHQAVAAAVNLGDYGVVGIHAVNLDYGDINGTIISNSQLGYDDIGNLNVTEMAVGLTYARRFSEKFGAGITVKYCKQDLIERESDALAFDIGTVFNTMWHDLKVAVSIQHFSREIKYVDENFELPLTFRVGFSVDALSLANLPLEDHSLTLALEGVNPRDYSERIHVGVEYWYKDFFVLRTGYKFNYDVEDFSFGAGVKFMGVEFDYAYSNFGSILGNVNRISLVYDF